MDAVVVIGGCDKTLPAQIMAAVSAGPPDRRHSRRADGGWTSQGRGAGRLHRLPAAVGQNTVPAKSDDVEIEAVNGRLAPSVGTCMVMGTASTMACITEALGLSLPMSATIPAPHAERFRSAEASGKVAAAMAKAKGPRPSEFLTASSFKKCAGGTAGDRRVDQWPHSSHRDRNRTKHRIDLEP